MKIIQDNKSIIENNNLCLVPTMGALHEGHISLIKTAKETGKEVIVSIFVNRLQFNDPIDFENYPRDLEKDLYMLKEYDVDFVFVPEEDYIYPQSGFELLSAGELGKRYEGISRPGHFDGVITVVNRLFEIIKPNIAIFGKKDFQQVFLIKKLIEDKKFETKIIENETLRANSGLALSSRNLHLSEKGLDNAQYIYKSLRAVKTNFLKTKNLEMAIKEGEQILSMKNIDLDYLEILDLETFSPLEPTTKKLIIIIAVLIENVRLIDNIQFEVEEN